jgi:hypothetical protein
VHGEASDITAREKNGVHDIGVRAEGKPRAIDRKDGAVVQRIEEIVAELRDDQLLNQLVAQLSAP